MNNEKKIQKLKAKIASLQLELAELEQEGAMSCCRPFPVPPSGCPEGWTESGGMCVLNS